MFCIYCGKQITDGEFCPHCGKRIALSQTNYQPDPQAQILGDVYDQLLQVQAQKKAFHQSEINSLDNAIHHFSQKKAEFDEYESVCNLVNYYAKGAKKGLIVWGAIIVSIGFLILYSALTGRVVQEDKVTDILLLSVIPGLLMIVGGISMQINNRKKYTAYQEQCANLLQELYIHYTKYPNCPVGPEYTNPKILVRIRNILISGRADTIKESINMLISDSNQDSINQSLAITSMSLASIEEIIRKRNPWL
ncbi:MAG: zinc ribbon domain-containing protein [Ruminococcaceae bacterium]|nr:zinc ribbon domain-containing protein [Oscillospiraceae bacterium]